MQSRAKVGIDLAPIAFRARAPGTATHVEHQARALLGSDVEWEWVPVATPRVLADSPDFEVFNPILTADAPLSYHVSFPLGRAWAAAGCALGLSTAFFSPFFGPPVVTNYFDSNAYEPVRDYRTQKERWKLAALRGMWKLSRRRARALFIDSEYARKRMVEVDPASAHKWVVAPCGYAPVPNATRLPGWAHALQGNPFVLYVGAFSENKNQRRLIQAWDQLRRRHDHFPHLVLVGPCPAEYFRDVIEPVRTSALHPQEIIMPGFVPTEEVAWAFRAAQSYLQPSFAEGFGIPIVEAMSCGVPVACSDSTSMPETAGDAAILFEPSSVESMARALERLVLNERERTELQGHGRARARLFTWERNAEIVTARIRQELAEIYDK
jgi:glycosyltransferase involved in cell wall biosynthesis